MKEIKFSPPDISEEAIAEVIDTLRSGWITTGPKTKLFESKIAEYCGTEKAVCLNSATAGLELILRLLGIGAGDEVIVPAYTYTSTASVVNHVGATIVFVDCAKDSYEMDYEQLSRVITSKTKAIIPVDIAGKIVDYEHIFEIVNQKKHMFHGKSPLQFAFGRVIIVADAAHSFGAKRYNQRSGNIADFTSFSFHAVKNLTTGEGGAVTWRKLPTIDSDDIYYTLMLLALHGQDKDALAKTKLGAWEYDIKIPGFKCNMTDIMASLGISQLYRYDHHLKQRESIIKKYDDGILDLNVSVLKHFGNNFSSSGHLYLIRLLGKDVAYRNDIIMKLAKRGIPANVHYKPLPMMTAYMNLGFDIMDYPNAFEMYKNEISLPLHTLLDDEQIEFIIQNFRDLIREQ